MDTIIHKFHSIEKIISQKKGDIRLFALFELEDLQNRWDVIVSAENLLAEDIESLRFVVSVIQNILDKEELIKIAKVVLFDPDDDFVVKIQNFLRHNDNPKKFHELEINNLAIKRGFIIKSSADARNLPAGLVNPEGARRSDMRGTQHERSAWQHKKGC